MSAEDPQTTAAETITTIHRKPRRPNYNHVHRNLLPVAVHPLPPLIPQNPLSLLTIAYVYLTQILHPPPRPTYNGYFSSATSSIHVTDAETVRALWEMGFFGRGSLSRSEPTWLQTQQKKGSTAEENTSKRRTERRHVKLERAKKEQSEIVNQLSKEMQTSNGHMNGNVLSTNENNLNGIASVLHSNSPNTPRSLEDLDDFVKTEPTPLSISSDISAKIDPSEVSSGESTPAGGTNATNTIQGFEEWKRSVDANGLPTPPPTSTCSESSQAESRPVVRLQKQKTVRFSPTIEAREFDLSSPVISPIKSPGSLPTEEIVENISKPLENKEHLHISLEEAFFLSYSLGVLNVYCDDSDAVLLPSSLISLFRRHSHNPPRSLSIPAEPDDPFMISYTAYHHYRSLGWVVRSGIKFGVDYLLYNRGPAFAHADFAIVVVPSYRDPRWKTEGVQGPIAERLNKTWSWLHRINRVQAQVLKQLVLCYIDIPFPSKKEEKSVDVDIERLFSRYKVRDVNVKRWTPNRARD